VCGAVVMGNALVSGSSLSTDLIKSLEISPPQIQIPRSSTLDLDPRHSTLDP
jgi:hypothetical protein